MDSVKEILMSRDGLEEYEADERIDEVKGIIHDLTLDSDTTLEDLEDVLADEFGLEPDYLMEFLL